MSDLILSCFKYKAVISDDGHHCKVIDPDGVVRGDNLTTQQALDLRYELYEKDNDFIAMSAFRFYVRQGLVVSLDYSPGGDFYMLEIQLPIGKELPKYALLENASIAFSETDIDRLTHSYLFSIIRD